MGVKALLSFSGGVSSVASLTAALILGFSGGAWFGGQAHVGAGVPSHRRLLVSQLAQDQAVGLERAAFPSFTRDFLSRVRSNPALLQNPSNLIPFLAAPWLLPPGSEKLLPYYGRGGSLEDLLAVQALPDPLGQSKGVVTLLYFNYQQAVMAMNCIYSLVKFGGVTSYVVVVWDERSREACAHLNFPCFDASAWLPGSVSDQEAKYGDHNFVAIMWLRTQFSRHVLRLGYTIHVSDVDLAYAPYDVHRSMLAYIHEVNATGTFPREDPVNTGSYMMLPTPRGLALMDAWVEEGQRQMAGGFTEQQVLCKRLKGTAYEVCERPSECDRAAGRLDTEAAGGGGGGNDTLVAMASSGAADKEGGGGRQGASRGSSQSSSSSKALLRTFLDARARLFGGFAALPLHPCSHPFLFWHATGVTGQPAKVQRLKMFGFWFVDEERCQAEEGEGREHLVRCPPLAWREEWVEGDFLTCDRSRLGLQFSRLPKELWGREAVGTSPRLARYAALA